jgi:hypothetical protein
MIFLDDILITFLLTLPNNKWWKEILFTIYCPSIFTIGIKSSHGELSKLHLGLSFSALANGPSALSLPAHEKSTMLLLQTLSRFLVHVHLLQPFNDIKNREAMKT